MIRKKSSIPLISIIFFILIILAGTIGGFYLYRQYEKGGFNQSLFPTLTIEYANGHQETINPASILSSIPLAVTYDGTEVRAIYCVWSVTTTVNGQTGTVNYNMLRWGEIAGVKINERTYVANGNLGSELIPRPDTLVGTAEIETAVAKAPGTYTLYFKLKVDAVSGEQSGSVIGTASVTVKISVTKVLSITVNPYTFGKYT